MNRAAMTFMLTLLLSINCLISISYANSCLRDADCGEAEFCSGVHNVEIKGEGYIHPGTCQKGVIIYVHANYKGASQGLTPGNYFLANILIGKTLSSLEIPKGSNWSATLYREDRFGGDAKIYTTSTPYVGDDFNDKTSSIRIANNKAVHIYQHADYKGFAQQLQPGCYSAHEISIAKTLSSLTVPNGWKATLYLDDHCHGNSKVYTTSTPYVGDDFNDKTSSIMVKGDFLLDPE